MKRHVTCLVEKAGVEPKTLGTIEIHTDMHVHICMHGVSKYSHIRADMHSIALPLGVHMRMYLHVFRLNHLSSHDIRAHMHLIQLL